MEMKKMTSRIYLICFDTILCFQPDSSQIHATSSSNGLSFTSSCNVCILEKFEYIKENSPRNLWCSRLCNLLNCIAAVHLEEFRFFNFCVAISVIRELPCASGSVVYQWLQLACLCPLRSRSNAGMKSKLNLICAGAMKTTAVLTAIAPLGSIMYSWWSFRSASYPAITIAQPKGL
jgi:hypothetical protein